MVVRINILTRPHWIISNQLTLPLLSADETGKNFTIRGLIQMAVPVTIFLDTLFNNDKKGLTSR